MANASSTPTAQILIIDDETAHAEVMAEALRRVGHVCTIVHNLPSALQELRHGSFDLVVTDLVMDSQDDGLKVLSAAKETQKNCEAILVTAHGDVPTAKAAIRGGAYDFIEKPLDLDVFRTLCDHAIQAVFLRGNVARLNVEMDRRYGLEGIIGASPAIQQVLIQVQQVAPTNIPVLITGESGTGKELVARSVYVNSPRNKKAFKPLNCAGLSESILESELFGHVKGAFTGAERDRQGVFEYADGGTLFLDEIGDMPLLMQAKLLRVLESGELVRVGSNEARHVDVRLISATNHDLQKLTKEAKFREDLYFRIKGAHIHLPPLRERREDIPLLVQYYLNHYAHEAGKESISIDDQAMTMLLRYDWPGNVRQLMTVVQNMVIYAPGSAPLPASPHGGGNRSHSSDIQVTVQQVPVEVRSAVSSDSGDGLGSLAGLSLEQIEKQAIRNALKVNQGNRETTAKMLGIGERTLYRKLKDYGLK